MRVQLKINISATRSIAGTLHQNRRHLLGISIGFRDLRTYGCDKCVIWKGGRVFNGKRNRPLGKTMLDRPLVMAVRESKTATSKVQKHLVM